MRNTIVFVSWTSPIVLEWLYRCDNDFSADFLNFGAGDLPFQVIFSVIENRVFLLGRRDPSGLGAAISDAVARGSIVFCNAVSGDRIVIAVPRLLGAAVACVIRRR